MENIQFGKRAADGSIEQDATTCALTGAAIVAGDVLVPVEGTPYFYRVAAGAYRHMTPEQHKEISAKAPVAPSTPVKRSGRTEGSE